MNAVKSFEKALSIKPDYAEAQYNLGVVLQELGQVDAAMKSYENALAINMNTLTHIIIWGIFF